jgi:glycosyltransferase involved in cell wall biosynthesis
VRILFISAFYPPYVVGGWEQLVQDININLQARGHVTYVLTSNYGVVHSSLPQPGVERSLSLESNIIHYKPLDFFLKRQRQLERNLEYTRATIQGFCPDVVFVHVMWNLNKGIPWVAEQLCPGRVVYYIANDWPYAHDIHSAYWRNPPQKGRRRLVKQFLASFALDTIEKESEAFPLRFEHVLCVSQAIRRELALNAQIPNENMRVVYNGVETDRFLPSKETRGVGLQRGLNGLSLLYAGSLVPHKGVHTAIEAMALLAHKPGLEKVQLTIVGSGHPDYEHRLRTLVKQAGLEDRVQFWPRVSREEMPELLQKFDGLVFPSIWDEPLARMMQEAMSAGLVVIGTPTGGTPEILQHGETGLTFQPGNAEGLAEQIDRLGQDPSLRMTLSENARRLVLNKFDLRRMIDEIEAYLELVNEQADLEVARQAVP